MAKLSDGLIQDVIRMGNTGLDPGEIARSLNLKKMQVQTILAHIRLKETQQVSPHDSLLEDDSELKQIAVEGAGESPENVSLITNEPFLEDEESRGIFVGNDRDHEDEIMWDPFNTQSVQNPHLMIMGESGSGKTYAAQCLIAELTRKDIPSIIFDYGQSFELSNVENTFMKFAKPHDHLIAETGLALNPLHIFPNDLQGPKMVATRLSDVFNAVYNLGDIQKKVLIDAILKAFLKVKIDPENRESWVNPPPTFFDLQIVLEDLASDKSYVGNKNAIGVSARLTTFFMLHSIKNDVVPWSWDDLIRDREHRVHILQFRGIEGKTQRILVELLLWHLFFYLKSQGQNPLRLYCVLDEAHHLSFRDGGPVDSLLREARKFGLGLIFASQQPNDFSPAAFSNSASKLIFQTSDSTSKISKALAAKCQNYSKPDEIRDLISVLQQGEAFFITKNKGYVVRVADFKKRGTLWV